MNHDSPGLRRYLYEHVFYHAIQRVQEQTNQNILVSSARLMRDQLDEELIAAGVKGGMDNPRLKIPQLLTSIEKVIRERVGYQGLFSDTSSANELYQSAIVEFSSITGLRNLVDRHDVKPDGRYRSLPISPYDPRWSNRCVVKREGSRQVYVPIEIVDAMDKFTQGRVDRLHKVRDWSFHLHRYNEPRRKLEKAGRAYNYDDLTGMSELMGWMKEEDYRKSRGWMILGASNERGYIDIKRCMSPQALKRSVAILDELRNQGVEYRVERDLNPGQLKVVIEGTKMSVRITDIRKNEHYIGRVYDSGMVTTYSTNWKIAGQRTYTPTPQETVALLHFAQGKPVQRGDNYLVGQLGGHKIRNNNEWKTIPNSYFSGSDSVAMFAVKQLETGGRKDPGAFVYIRQDASNRAALSTWFSKPEAAEEFLHKAVTSARYNMRAALDVNRLVADYQRNTESAIEEDYFPEFSGDPEIAAMQRSYWDVLRGAQTALLRPGISEEEYRTRIESIGTSIDGPASQAARNTLMAQLSYVGTPEQQVHDHAEDALDDLIGTFQRREVTGIDGLKRWERFNPGQVAERMTSEHGQFRNQADIVAAMRVVGIRGDELMGEDSSTQNIRNRLISFDHTTAVSADKIQDPFLRRMVEVTSKAIERNGGKINSLVMDGNGIIRYEVHRYQMNGRELKPTVGEIGQFFSPGEHGEVVTHFASGNNYMFVPGYKAHVLPQELGEQKSLEERTVLRGYEQIIREQIEHRISSDMMTMRTRIGEPSSLNSVYRSLYDTRHEIDFLKRTQEQGLSKEWVEAILATEARRVRYSNSLASDSTMHAEWKAKNYSNWDASNDNYNDPLVHTGRNMVVLAEEGDGFFDPNMTGNSVNQGIVRYLTTDARVNSDGTITPGGKDGQTPLMSMPELATMRHDPWDRRQMTLVNLLNASAVTEKEGTAFMTFGGWGLDDPVVVSKEFAQKYQVRDSYGQMRPLAPGDKISDLHGNKGVVSLAVDRDAIPGIDFDADDTSLVHAHQVFISNPDLHVVMPPFSAVSRFNGGTAREMMENPQDLQLLDKGVLTGALGYARYIITNKTADEGTRVYDQQARTQGQGRKASAQLAWALGAQGCEKIMAEIYGPNASGVANLREMLVTVGLDIEPDGTLRVGYDDLSEGSARRLFAMPELVRTSRGTLNMRKMREDFSVQIGDKGGQLELPFPLKMPTGDILPQVSETSWGLPVMSAHLRSGSQDIGAASSIVHDYTNHYSAIFRHACVYRHAIERLAVETDTKKVQNLKRMVQEAPHKAQDAYDLIANDLKRRRFSGKRNVFRENVMSTRLPNSATAVWTCDPRLDIDQVSMGPAMAEALGLSSGDYAMIWRDPVLRDSGVRYMRVSIDERLTGVAINPVMDKSFDGDFDGDSVGVVRLTNKPAQTEALERLTVEANLLDLGSQDGDGFYPLAMQDSLDVKVSQHVQPELAERFADLKRKANDTYTDLIEGAIDRPVFLKRNQELVEELNKYYREAMEDQYGDAVLRFGSTEEHMKSVLKACIEPGAKGSVAKLRDYSRYLGADPDTFVDLGQPQNTREDDQGVMIATAVKAHGTGVAGMYSQRGVKALRDEELKAVLELTYPVTQSILQSKHDPAEALHKYNMIMGPVRALWKGRMVSKVREKQGREFWEVEGMGEQARTEEWVQAFLQVYTAKDGLNVSIRSDYVEAVARALSKSGEMINIEGSEEAVPYKTRAIEKGSTLDRLAYGGKFEDLLAAAEKKKNLFDGEQSKWFTPHKVLKNKEYLEQAVENPGLLERVRVLSKDDTQPRFGEKAQVATGMEIRVAEEQYQSGPKRIQKGLQERSSQVSSQQPAAAQSWTQKKNVLKEKSQVSSEERTRAKHRTQKQITVIEHPWDF